MKGNKEFYCIYNQLYKDAIKAYKQGKEEKCYELIKTAATTAYTFNQFFFDSKLEILLKKNTELIHKTSINKDTTTSLTSKKRIVFFDTNGLDNRGLTQQYIRAFFSLNYSVLYIYIDGNEDATTNNPKTIEEIKNYSDSKIAVFSKKQKYTEKIKKIIQIVKEFNADYIFSHLMPWDVVSLAVIYIFRNIKSYNINLTDEAFWLGASFFDYNIEFRNYGYTISLEKRLFKPEQLLYLPYYPIIPLYQEEFKGFPSNIPPHSIKIFTGGNFYKIFDKENSFFKLMDRILQNNENAIILIAGNGNMREFYKRLRRLSNKNRIFYIGVRKDINEVFKRCDIYLSTYPISGALMAQYAALNAKPIIAYTDKRLIDNKLEEIICYNTKQQLTNYNIDITIKKSIELCTNEAQRVKEGTLLQKAIISKNQFNQILYDILNHKSQLSIIKDYIDYQYIAQVYLNIRNEILNDIIILLIKVYKYRFLIKFPSLIPYIPTCMIRKIYDRIKN